MKLSDTQSFVRGAALATGISIFLCTASSIAQSLGDVENAVTTGGQYNDALIDAQNRQESQSSDADLIDGEAGVFILSKNEIFSLSVFAGTGYTDNPGRSLDVSAGGSATAFFAVAAGVNTRIAQRFEAGGNFVVSGTEYNRGGAPDSRNVVTNAYIGKQIFGGSFYTSLSASFGYGMSGRFGSPTRFSGLTANLTTARALTDTLVLRPELSVARQWSENSEQDNTSATADLQIIWAPAAQWRVAGSMSFSHRKYDDFYESLTFVERKDDVWRLNVSVLRQFQNGYALSASAGYVDQESDFFLSSYDSLDGGLNLHVSKRF